MRARTFLILTLLLSLAFGASVRAVPSGAKACVTSCEKNCCAETICCTHPAGQQPQPAQAPASPQTNLDLGILGLESFFVLFVRPPVEHRFAPRETVQAHVLPPLAASCIRLI